MDCSDKFSLKFKPAGGPFQDPALLVTPENSGESLLFDCGTLHSLKTRDLLRTRFLLLSHLHIDHLIGFDHLLRVRLFSELPLTVLGPSGVTEVIGHRLQGYAWNLTSGSPFVVQVVDLEGEKARQFRCHERFEPETMELSEAYRSDYYQVDSDLQVRWQQVNHGVPCLAYRLHRNHPPKFLAERAKGLGLSPGPWVKELLAGKAISMSVQGVTRDSHWLKANLLAERAVESLGYLTDTRLDDTTLQTLVEFFQNVGVLVSETAYLQSEETLAQENLHMTTTQVGKLATLCGADNLRIFHLSRRHMEAGPENHLREVREVFAKTELLSRSPSETPS